MPQVIPDFGRTSNNPGDGTARINLRGMGSGRTLVLLNGRRLAPSGVGSAVDLNNLPQALIDRVEIVTGGASTVYGSDAVAGVVNFITRDDLSGLIVEAGTSMTAENDAGVYDVNLAYGHSLASGRGNVAVYAGYQDRESLFAADRSLTRVSYANDDSDGTLYEAGSPNAPGGMIFFPPVDFGNGPAPTTFDADGTPRQFGFPADLYNFQAVNYLQTPLSRYAGGVLASYGLASGYELYLEFGYSRNESSQQLAPAPARGFVVVNTDSPLLTSETAQLFSDNFEVSPGVAQFGFLRRVPEVGPRISEQTRDYWRTVAGLRGEVANGWELDAWLTYTSASEVEHLRNAVSASRFQQGLLVDPATGQCFDPSGGCVPVDPFGTGRISPAAADFIRIGDIRNDTERNQAVASIVMTGSPLEGWAGDVDTAIGLEWRSDKAHYKADDKLFTGDALGYTGDAAVAGTERVLEIYGEARVPLARDAALAQYLGLELGVRYSRYGLAGGVWTYKAGGEWQPVDALRFRAMHQRSVRAPNNLELFQALFAEDGIFIGEDSSDDPCSASNDPVQAGFLEKCVIQGLPAAQVGVFEASTVPVQRVHGGNPELEPEISDTWTVGAVITPEALAGFELAVDYFSLEVTDSIGDIDSLSICFDPANTANLFCENIRRDPNLGGNVVEFYEPQSNRGAIGTRGIDTQISYRSDLPAAVALFENHAQLGANVIWTHLLEASWQLNPATQVVDCVGYFGSFCGLGIDRGVGATLPENRVTTRISYLSGPFSVQLTSRWIDGARNVAGIEAAFFGLAAPLLAIPEIGSRHYLDLGVGYAFTDGISVRLGVDNLTDTGAPNMADAVFTNNTDTLLYDVFGRSYYLNISVGYPQ